MQSFTLTPLYDNPTSDSGRACFCMKASIISIRTLYNQSPVLADLSLKSMYIEWKLVNNERVSVLVSGVCLVQENRFWDQRRVSCIERCPY